MTFKKHIPIILLVFVFLYALDAWYTHRFRTHTQYKTQWILQKENKEYDYVVLGASHSYVGFDMELMDKETGFKGINISLDGSLIPTQSVLADIFFRRNNNKTKYLLFSVDNPSSLNTEILTDIADGRMMPYLDYPEVANFYLPHGKSWYFKRYVPFWKYAEYNYYWGPHAFANTFYQFLTPDFDTSHGSRYEFRNFYDSSDKDIVDVDFHEKSNFKYMDKILSICKEKNIHPIFFTLPLGRADTTVAARKHIEDFTAFTKQRGIDYIYMGDYLNYQFEYFSTKGHLNKKGAELSTARLLQLMKENKYID